MDDAIIVEEDGFLMAKGKTSHTSAINADYPIRTEEQDPYLVVTVVDGKGKPLTRIQVRTGVAGTYSGFRAFTDEKGQVCRQVPADRNMEIQAWGLGSNFPDTPRPFATGPKRESGDCANPNLTEEIKIGLAAIRGRILDADGTPMQGARVYANPVDYYWRRTGLGGHQR
jgi:protocatechuate 3,4-dioxygenase beta subunit